MKREKFLNYMMDFLMSMILSESESVLYRKTINIR